MPPKAKRDIRRFAAVAIIDGPRMVTLALGGDSIIHRVVTAGLVDGAWVALPGGHCAGHCTGPVLDLSVKAAGRETAVLVEWTRTAPGR